MVENWAQPQVSPETPVSLMHQEPFNTHQPWMFPPILRLQQPSLTKHDFWPSNKNGKPSCVKGMPVFLMTHNGAQICPVSSPQVRWGPWKAAIPAEETWGTYIMGGNNGALQVCNRNRPICEETFSSLSQSFTPNKVRDSKIMGKLYTSFFFSFFPLDEA